MSEGVGVAGVSRPAGQKRPASVDDARRRLGTVRRLRRLHGAACTVPDGVEAWLEGVIAEMEAPAELSRIVWFAVPQRLVRGGARVRVLGYDAATVGELLPCWREVPTRGEAS